MQQDKEITSTDRVVIFIEKWILFFLVLTPYLFLSYKIIDSLANPDPSTKYCGNGLFAALLAHIIIAIIATIVLTLKMFLGKGYDKWTKIIVLLLIIIPPIISYSLLF